MSKAQRYISDELTHFVGKGQSEDTQYELLVQVLTSGWLTHRPHRPNISGNLSVIRKAKLSCNDMYLPQVVCFCDIPIDDLHIHSSKYSCFGLSLSKQLIVQQGGAPVLYLPRDAQVNALRFRSTDLCTAVREVGSAQDTTSLGELFDTMVRQYLELFQTLLTDADKHVASALGALRERLLELEQFLDFHLFSYVKFFDHRLKDDDPENFYMEREWRVVGNVRFTLDDVCRVLIPPKCAKRLRTDVPDYCGQLTFVER